VYNDRTFQSRRCPFVGSSTSSSSSSCRNDDVIVDSTGIILEVCLSPGCLADGAQVTLQKIEALLADGTSTRKVVKGVCCSLCGNGPVVVLNGNRKIRQVNNNDKILKLLTIDSNDDDYVDKSDHPRFQSVLQSFELIEQARAFIKSKDFVAGTKLFQEGINLGMNTFIKGKFSSTQAAYLIEALKEQTIAFLQIPAKKDAVDAAQRCVDLIRNSNDYVDQNEVARLVLYSSLECLQETLEACSKDVPTVDRKNLAQELEVLRELMSLPVQAGLSTVQQNRRRSLGFRLQKLERKLK
jgi:hypothetical protein